MIYEKLSAIQRNLKAPKGQFNKFGNYKYRSCEDILEAVKPLLGDCFITIMDDIVQIGDRIYVKAIATISDGESSVSTQAFARESEDKKGMDASQITGSASSYARKYALNGLLLIDDTKDADTQDNRQGQKQCYPQKDFSDNFPKWKAAIESGKRDPDSIIAMIQTKGQLTEQQIAEIKGIAA